jgi:hypothetical protein
MKKYQDYQIIALLIVKKQINRFIIYSKKKKILCFKKCSIKIYIK